MSHPYSIALAYIQGVPVPQVEHQSKIALKLKSMNRVSFERLLMRWLPVIEQKPDLIDNLNLDEQLREDWRASGLQSDNLYDEEEVSQIREARAAQMEQERQAAMMLEAGKVAGGLIEKSAPADVEAALAGAG